MNPSPRAPSSVRGLARRMGYELMPINGQQQERAAPWVRSE